MFAGKTSTRGFLPGIDRRAVRYRAEPLEGRVLLSPMTESELAQDAQLPERSVLIARLNAHELTAQDMDLLNVADVEWNGRPMYAKKDQWLVKLDTAELISPHSGLQQLLDDVGLGAIYRDSIGRDDLALVEVPAGTDHGDLVAAVSARRTLEYAEPNLITWAAAVPNDAYYDPPADPYQWYLNNSGTTDSHIHAEAAWNITTGSASVVVAVLDEGLKTDHEDIVGNLWVNSDETAGDNDDDDGNGYRDDRHGWNATATLPEDEGDLEDGTGHGTHVSGLIGATGQTGAGTGAGIAGVAWDVSLMAMKVMPEEGTGTATSVLRGLQYVIDACEDDDEDEVNVRVSNHSYETTVSSLESVNAKIAELAALEVVIVSAAGNSGTDNDEQPRYPPNSPNVISVAATNEDNEYAYSSPGLTSNRGSATVHLGAPGDGVLSTTSTATNSYGVSGGTSQASPLVAGVAALAASLSPSPDMATIRAAILQGTDPNDSLLGRTVTGGRLNAFNTLDMINGQPKISGVPQKVSGTGSGETIHIRPASNPSLLEVMIGTSYHAINGATISSIKWLHVEGLGGGDTITVDPAITFPVWVEGGADNDTITGGSGRDMLEGGDGNDSLIGANGHDILLGGAGTDLLRGGDGNDSTGGGPGSDTYSYSGASLDTDSVGELPDEDTDLIDLTGFTHNNNAVTINLSQVRASGAAVTHAGSGLSVYLGNNSAVENAKGSAFSDTFIGNSRTNTFWGEAGNDTYNAGSSDPGGDTFNGGSGTDTVTYESRSSGVTVSLDGSANDGPENDNIKTDVESVLGTNSADTLSANEFTGATLAGNAGNDVLRGGDGIDQLDGGSGADTLVGNPGADVINGQADNDLIFGDSDDPNYTGGGNDTIDAGDSNDYVYGGPADDTITGGGGGDTLLGENGSDTFRAQDGTQDILTGGNGTDICVLADRDDGTDLLSSIEIL